MKNILFLLIVFLSAGVLQVNAQEVKKEIKKEVKKEGEKKMEKMKKKVVIKKKTVKEDGTVVEEVMEAEGAEADALLKKMKEEEGLEDVEIDLEMEGDMTIHKSHGDEKMIKVNVDTKEIGDGENVFVIKVDDGDGEKEFNWTSEDGEMPEEMKKYMKDGNVIIHMDKDGKGNITKKINIVKDHKVIHKSHGEEKMIKVGVDTRKDSDGENVFIIKVDDGDGEKEFNWTSEDGEMPEEMKKYMKDGNMIIHVDEDGEGDMKEFIVKVESDEVMPDVNVRMGIELINTQSTLEVGNVQEGSPAAEAGLASGDMITEIDGYHIADYSALMERLSKHKPGDKIEVRYIRDGKASTAQLKLAAKE
ncbi:MAG: PDZ domain-containing protein [Saprospiraceae bacterium]|nr:PDZ domain-containing protein [Saprospiraceae bacterium]